MEGHEHVARPELARMVRGRGRFVDDVKLPGMCFAAFVRSDYAHANIKAINVEEALKITGGNRRHHAGGSAAAREPGATGGARFQ